MWVFRYRIFTMGEEVYVLIKERHNLRYLLILKKRSLAN